MADVASGVFRVTLVADVKVGMFRSSRAAVADVACGTCVMSGVTLRGLTSILGCAALQLHEKSLMLAKLDPPLGRFDPSLLRTHAGWDVVDLKNHIVVCGLPHNVADFLRPIKSAARKQKVTVLFVADWDLSDDQLRMIFPPNIPIHNPWSTLDVFVLHAPPLNPASMKRANVGHASRILLLSEHAGPEAEEPGLMDAAVVFAHRYE
eukprot:1402872-Rhodomonas_salina.5